LIAGAGQSSEARSFAQPNQPHGELKKADVDVGRRSRVVPHLRVDRVDCVV
jgi:hypothetical protein